MSRIYHVIKDFLGPGDFQAGGVVEDGSLVDSVSTSPYSVIAVWRYKHPYTYSRKQQKSFTLHSSEAVRLRDTVLLVVNDIKTLSVECSKSTHNSSLSASLLPGMNYLSEVLPGDIVAAWMVNDRTSFDNIVEQLRTGKSANGFLSGFKFLGKVTSVQKVLAQQAGGIKNSVYSLNAHSFTELDGSIYYEPYLETIAQGLATDFLRMGGVKINKVLRENKLGLDINKIIPLYLNIFFGPGINRNLGIKELDLNLTLGLDSPDAFIVPAPVAQVLGVTKATKPNGLFGYNDILEVLFGIQKYDWSVGTEDLFVAAMGRQTSGTDMSGAIFAPDGMSRYQPQDRHRYTTIPMLGTYLPSAPQFSGQRTVWQIIDQYLNKTVNEMYTCMRANAHGSIMPTLVVRQLPFSSSQATEEYEPKAYNSLLARKNKQIERDNESRRKRRMKRKSAVSTTGGYTGADQTTSVATYKEKTAAEDDSDRQLIEMQKRKVQLTRMLEIPRWKIHPVLVKNYNVGRSDSMRFNFMKIDADAGQGDDKKVRTPAFIRNPPFADHLDIMRNGFRPYFASVNCAPKDLIGAGPTDWMYILSDIVFGQYLALSGSMEICGVQAPIVPGDNMEFDDAIFHIESVRHTFSIAPGGQKTFTTSLSLSHGVRAEQMQESGLSMYTGIKSEDLGGNDPTVSTESDGSVDERLERNHAEFGNIDDEEDTERAVKEALKEAGGRSYDDFA